MIISILGPQQELMVYVYLKPHKAMRSEFPSLFAAADFYGLPKLVEIVWHAVEVTVLEDDWNMLLILQGCLHETTCN
jgi:hypothetical protein